MQLPGLPVRYSLYTFYQALIAPLFCQHSLLVAFHFVILNDLDDAKTEAMSGESAEYNDEDVKDDQGENTKTRIKTKNVLNFLL